MIFELKSRNFECYVENNKDILPDQLIFTMYAILDYLDRTEGGYGKIYS